MKVKNKVRRPKQTKKRVKQKTKLFYYKAEITNYVYYKNSKKKNICL